MTNDLLGKLQCAEGLNNIVFYVTGQIDNSPPVLHCRIWEKSISAGMKYHEQEFLANELNEAIRPILERVILEKNKQVHKSLTNFIKNST